MTRVGFQTDCTSTGEDRTQFNGSIPPPIYQTSLFTHPSYETFRAAFSGMVEGADESWIYSRGNNPTVRALERKLALLEHGENARVFASGMAAIAAAILSTARAGDHVIAPRSIYSNAYRLVQGYLPTLGIETSFVDLSRLEEMEAAIQPNTQAVYLESPGNPAMQLIDLVEVAELARRHGLTTIADNSMATPYNQRPLELGIDLVVHSVSKYLSGHSDVVAGAVVGHAERIHRIAQNEIRDLGGQLGPFEAWLVLRGVRTLGLRMRAHNDSGMRVARWLAERQEIASVFYPGLAAHPQHELACRQMRGYGGMLSVVVNGGMDAAVGFVDRLRLFGIGVSWGGFESLALPIDPAGTAFADELGVAPGFVRISIGLEDVEDLLADLDQALTGVVDD